MESVIVTAVVGAFAALGTHVLTLEATRARMRRELEIELDRDLRAARRTAYVELWKRLEPLAIYAPPGQVDASALRRMSASLREWYYQIGGVYLTKEARAAYFALQDHLQADRADVVRPADRRFVQGTPPIRFRAIGPPMPAADADFIRLFDAASALRSSVADDLRTRAPLMEPSADT